MKPCQTGENSTLPTPAADIPTPITSVRRPGSTTRTIAATASENDVKARPVPTISPPTIWKASGASTKVMIQTPSA